MPDTAVLTDPIELHTSTELSIDHQIAGHEYQHNKDDHEAISCDKSMANNTKTTNSKQSNFNFCLDIIKTMIALSVLYSFYFAVYFACIYFSMVMGHHSYLGYFIFFFAFVIVVFITAYSQLCRKKQEEQPQSRQFVVESNS